MPQLCMFFLTTGAFNYIYGYFAVGVALVIFYQGLKQGHIWVNAAKQADFWILFLFGISYAVLGYRASIQSILYYVLIPLLSYLAGWVVMEVSTEKTAAPIVRMVMAAMLGCCVHAALNYVSNIGKERWMLTDFFTGALRAATGSGSINTIAFSLVFYFMQMEKRPGMKALGWGCVGVSALYAVLLGTRTQFVILVLCFLGGAGLYFFSHRNGRDKAVLLLRICMIGAAACLVYSLNLFGVQDDLRASNLNARFVNAAATSKTDTQRLESIAKGLVSLLENPLGGLNASVYFHNMWLDAGRVGGIIPALLLLLFTVSHGAAVRSFFLSDAEEPEKYLVVLLTCGLMLNFFVEPVLEGLYDSFYFFLILHGMLKCHHDARVRAAR